MVATEEQVGWLINAAFVVCMECMPHPPRGSLGTAPIFKTNLRPYRQPCKRCGKELVEPHCGVVLFNGN